MAVEVWARNPKRYLRECADVGLLDLIWDKGFAVKHGIDPEKFASMMLRGRPWRAITIDIDTAWCYGPEGGQAQPLAVWPVWDAHRHGFKRLLDYIKTPYAERHAAIKAPKVQERAVKGQEHRIMIVSLPDLKTGPGKKLMYELSEIQEEFPDVTLHIHGLYSWRAMFGLAFKATDTDPIHFANCHEVMLPNGKHIHWNQTVEYVMWVRALGYMPIELQTPDARIRYNLQSAQWAAENFRRSMRFRTAGFEEVDPDSPLKYKFVSTAKRLKLPPAHEGDKFLCDICTLQRKCQEYREGSVCGVATSDGAELAAMFGSRDSGQIIDGLGRLLKVQSERLSEALEAEAIAGELNPETTKIINGTFDRAEKLAKLVDPALTLRQLPAGAQTQINVINGASQATLMAAVMAALEEQGVPRHAITVDLVKSFLAINDPDQRQKAIEAKAVEVTGAA